MGRMKIAVAALDYTMSNPMVRVYLEGSDDEGITVTQDKLTTLDLQPGQYCFAVADAGVSVNSLDGVRLNVYPNPANSTLTLKTDATRTDKAVVFDSLGHKVKTLRINGDQQEININGLPAGNYVIVLYHKGKSVARTMFVKM